MLLASVLFAAVGTGCSNGEAHWLQPYEYDKLNASLVDTSLLEFTKAKHAWCYPTAAASLLAKLAHDGKWDSKMATQYPTATQYTSSQHEPWADYIWHEKTTLNLGHYTKTNVPDGR